VGGASPHARTKAEKKTHLWYIADADPHRNSNIPVFRISWTVFIGGISLSRYIGSLLDFSLSFSLRCAMHAHLVFKSLFSTDVHRRKNVPVEKAPSASLRCILFINFLWIEGYIYTPIRFSVLFFTPSPPLVPFKEPLRIFARFCLIVIGDCFIFYFVCVCLISAI